MMRLRLHSAQTYLLKLVFPFVYVFGVAVAAPILFPESGMPDGQGVLSAGQMQLAAVLAGVAGAVLIVWSIARLKLVWLERDRLDVSNLVREVAIPLADVEDVTENRWLSIHPVTIHLAHESAFGRRVTFVPSWRLLYWQDHPVVEQILDAVATARGHATVGGPAA
jgi:hypothetical protein